ncbi:hypothetical protein [Paraburkholderia metrosideri]|jgi:hypothetical protein|uniref:Uncharacterized protein n=1 Tax=Paraburkholderia metrosideri TaxID=580937 RepID=A0ABM8NLL2_9BURK|nr:hypothetical protein [Paraburkholderia metrosideri]CAD6531752.1 hypothetical protein LMG28140_02539 [Paraburkholderia metrosideri]
MAHADLAVLGGVGILALACLTVCGVYLYWGSDAYRSRRRRREFEAQILRPLPSRSPKKQKSSTPAIPQNDEEFSGANATMGTQLSHRCKTSLFRAVFNAAHGESIVFLIADDRDDARTRATGALAAIYGLTAHNVALSNLAAFRELVDIGISEDEDMRIFEMAWKGTEISAWVQHPLFLTDEPSLLGKWAELYADLARELATSAIEKARH